MADNEEMEVEESGSMGDDLRSAMESLGDEGYSPEETPEVEDTHEASAEAAPEAAQEEVPEQGTEGEPAAEPEAAAAPDIAPPVGATPKVAEAWKDVPADVKEFVKNRDQQVNRLLEETKANRTTANNFNQLVEGYKGVFAAEGVQDPMQGIQGLINITAQLQSGTQQMKAERIAGLIKHYGVDIAALDALLVGEQPQMTEEQRVQQLVQQQLKPYQQERHNAEVAKQRQVFENASQSIEQFGASPENEFFDHVREEMANWLEYFATQKKPCTLKQAYDRACAGNPEIMEIQAKRRSGSIQQNNQANVTAKRNAASSISGRTQGGGTMTESTDMRSIMESAWDEQVG